MKHKLKMIEHDDFTGNVALQLASYELAKSCWVH